MNDLAYVSRWPDTCDHEVSRRGQAQPCEKPAVAARLIGDDAYPVCAYHARGEMVPLRDLLAWRGAS